MFDQYIRFHARMRPRAVAVSSLIGDATYGRLDGDIDRMAAELARCDLAPDALAAVCVAHPYLHCVILFALARIGVASVSVGHARAEPMAALLAPHLFITDSPTAVAAVPGLEVLTISDAWANDVFSREAAPMPRVERPPHALARLTTSSGTTGIPKKIALTWAELDRRIVHYVMTGACMHGGDAIPISRMMPMFGIETISYVGWLSTWAIGGAILMAAMDATFTDALSRLSPSSLALSPIQLKTLMQGLPSDFLPMSQMAVVTGGSHLPAALAQDVRLRLSPNLWIAYGSTEAGVAAQGYASQLDVDAGAVGFSPAEVKVEVVDDDDRPVAIGRSGRIRIHSPTAASEYLDAPDATAESFKDGWFYPGDAGSLSAEGLLRVEGRTDDVMNLGGEKFMPLTLETPALQCAGVKDAAAFVVQDESGLGKPWLAVVRGDDLDEAQLARALQIPLLPPVHVAWIDEIPRNGMGKIQRDQLRTAAKRLQAAGG